MHDSPKSTSTDGAGDLCSMTIRSMTNPGSREAPVFQRRRRRSVPAPTRRERYSRAMAETRASEVRSATQGRGSKHTPDDAPHAEWLLYERIADEMAEAIRHGALRTGDRMPSVRRLARQRRVSVATVLQAYLRLEDDGLLEVRPRSGTLRSGPPGAEPGRASGGPQKPGSGSGLGDARGAGPDGVAP